MLSAECQATEPAAAWWSARLFTPGGTAGGVSPLGSLACPARSSVQAARVLSVTCLRDLWFLQPPFPRSGSPRSQEEPVLRALPLWVLAVPQPPRCSRGVHGFLEGPCSGTAHVRALLRAPSKQKVFFFHSPPPWLPRAGPGRWHPNPNSAFKDERHLQHPAGTSHQLLGLSNLTSRIPPPKAYILKLMQTTSHL